MTAKWGAFEWGPAQTRQRARRRSWLTFARFMIVALAFAALSGACGSTTPIASTALEPTPSAGAASQAAPSPTPSATASASPAPTQRAPGDLGTIEFAPPASARVLETATWGEVPVNQVLLVLEDGKGRADADAIAAALGGRVVGQIDLINAFQVETSGQTEADLKAALETARNTAGVELAAPNQAVKPLDDSGEIWGTRISPAQDPVYAGSAGDGYKLIGVEKAWEYIRGSGMPLDPTQVGIVDTGLYPGTGEFDGDVNITYTDPAAQLTGPEQVTYSDGTKAKDPAAGHGTSANTLIGANAANGGPMGIASPMGKVLTISNTNLYAPPYGSGQDVKSAPVAATPDPNNPAIQEYGNSGTYSFSGLAAIMAQVKAGSTVINLSWGSKDYKTEDPEMVKVYRKFFDQLAREKPNVVFVVAAGNDGIAMNGDQYFPGGISSPNVITVGNVNNDGTLADTSNKPTSNFEVTLNAPGEESVRGYDPSTGTVTRTRGGTSMSAPQVAATAALLHALNSDLDAKQIKDIIAVTAKRNKGVLAVDEAVRAVIDMNRDLAGRPRLDAETLANLGVIDAVAKPLTDAQGEYLVRGIVQATTDKGTDVSITVEGGAITDGDSPRHIAQAGELGWTVKLNTDKGVITVHRLDNGAGSRITIEKIDISGSWKGTITFTEIKLDPEAQKQAEDLAKEQGCDLATALEGLKGKALPMTLKDVKVSAQGKGKATLFIDMSSIKDAKGKPIKTNPAPVTFTYSGNRIVFDVDQTKGSTTSMSGVVTKSGDVVTMSGTLKQKGEGYSMVAVWTLGQVG